MHTYLATDIFLTLFYAFGYWRWEGNVVHWGRSQEKRVNLLYIF